MKNLWIFLSFLACINSAIGVLFLKYIDDTTYDNYTVLSLTFIIMGIVSFIYLLCNSKIKKKIINFDNKLIRIVILFAIILILNNIIMQHALKISPNVGYCHLIINLNIIITLFAGYFLFKQQINFKTFFGILVTLIGIGIVILNSNN